MELKKWVLMTVITIIAVLGLMACGTGAKFAEASVQNDATEASKKEDNKDGVMTSLYGNHNLSDGDNVYDWVDPDTGVHYLIYSYISYGAGAGGITPRLTRDGHYMVD